MNSDQNKATETAEKSVERKDVNGSFLVSRPSEKEGMVNVKAVLTVRKKMKEKLVDKIEDQWEYFINGIGQGIMIQLISEEIDPGLLPCFLFQLLITRFSLHLNSSVLQRTRDIAA